MPRYIEQLNECTDPVAADWLWIVDDSALADDKDRKVSVGKLALRGTAQTFTKAQTIAPDSATQVGLTVNMPTSNTVNGIDVSYNGSPVVSLLAWSNGRGLVATDFDNGAGSGCNVVLGRNNNAGTPAAAMLTLAPQSGTNRRLWVDASGNLRIHTANITFSNDTAGTVVGTQTSMAETKNLLDGLSPIEQVLARIVAGVGAVQRFTFKSGAFDGQEFEGVIIDNAPEYGMDRDAEHPQGKSLNEIQILGDLLRAVAYLSERVQHLESRIRAMEAT